jgi:uncharacterized protein YjdB
MPFKHKLSRRLALARLHIAFPVLLLTACTDLVDSTPEFTQLAIKPSDVMIEPRETVLFEAQGITPAGDTIPADAQWSASGGDIANDGLFTASAEDGPYVVSATSTKNGKLKRTARVEVRSPLDEFIIVPDSVDLAPGASLQFFAYGRRKGDSMDVDVSYTATGGAIITNGTYTAGDPLGRYVVVATEQRSDYHNANRKRMVDTATVHIRVANAPVASVSVTPATATLTIGETAQFTTQVLDSAGNDIQGAEISWLSSTSEVATVSSNGLVTAIALGTAAIVASSQGYSDTATVTATEEPSGIVITNLAPSDYELDRLKPGVLYHTDRDFSVTSVPEAYDNWWLIQTANDDKGSITFDLATTATVAIAYDKRATQLPSWLAAWDDTGTGLDVSATAASPMSIRSKVFDAGHVVLGGNLSGGASGAETMYVPFVESFNDSTPPPNPPGDTAVVAVRVSPSSIDIVVGTTAQLTATPIDKDGNELTDRSVTWLSTDESVATVDANGLVTGQAQGCARAIATSEGVSGSASVVVRNPSGDPVECNPIWPNEPVGFVALEDQPYDTQVWTENGSVWTRSNGGKEPTDVMRIVDRPPEGQPSPTKAYENFFAEGMEGGVGPGGMRTRVADNRESVYFGAHVMYSENWHCHGSGSNKLFLIWYNGTREHLILQWRGCNQIWSYTSELGLLRPNVDESTVDMFGKWAMIEWLVQRVGGTTWNQKWWVNGTLRGDFDFPVPEGPGSVDAIDLEFTWGGLGGNKRHDDFIWVDHVYISPGN